MITIEVFINQQWERIQPTIRFNTIQEACDQLQKISHNFDLVRVNCKSGYIYYTGEDCTKKYPGLPKGWESFLA